MPAERIINAIYVIRRQKVMLDRDLAELYGVPTRVLNQAVRRNRRRFPLDFMFQLTSEEFTDLKSQIVTSSWGGTRKPPLAFSEQGVAMLSSVLHSESAIQVNIQIIRTFTRLRQILSGNEKLRRKVLEHDKKIEQIFVVLNRFIEGSKSTKHRQIGF